MVKIQITAKGQQGSGKSRAIRAMIDGLKNSYHFDIYESVNSTMVDEERQILEVTLKD